MNNSETKFHFFLPQAFGLPSDMVAIITLLYPFRISLYELFLDNRVASLKPEFAAKVGMIFSNLYGRVATSDLEEFGWTQADSIDRINPIINKYLPL